MIILNKAKNYWINGCLSFWQRGDSFTNIASSAYFADRFMFGKSGSATVNVTKSSSIPTLSESKFPFSNSVQFTVGTAQTSLAASDQYVFGHLLEGLIVSPIYGRKITISFLVKSSVLGTYAMSLRNLAGNRSYVATYTINQINTYERKSITLTHDSLGVWDKTSDIGIRLFLTLAMGTTYQAPQLNTWLDGNYLSHASCTNGVATAGATFNFTGFQLEEGTEPSNFERAGGNYINELALCQRYYKKSYPFGTAPGTATTIGCMYFTSSSTGGLRTYVSIGSEMRAIPTVTIYNPTTGAAGSIDRSGTAVAASGDSAGTNSFNMTTGATLDNYTHLGHYTANAEL